MKQRFSNTPSSSPLNRESVAYAARYCEENVWHLCQRQELAAWERLVVFISNHQRGCPFWQQRASPIAEEPILWDYHVVLFARPSSPNRDQTLDWLAFDVDSRLTFPTNADEYLTQTFPVVDLLSQIYMPSFRVTSADEYVENFSSDRSHMRDEDGGWLAPPPTWPLIESGDHQTLPEYFDFHSNAHGEIMDFSSFKRTLGGDSSSS